MLKPEKLFKDQVLICKIKPAKGSKIQLEFAEIIPIASSLLARGNSYDPRFRQAKPMRCWFTMELENAKEYFPSLEKAILKVDETLKPVDVSLLNPEMDGQKLHILVKESTGAELCDEYAECTSKQTGRKNEIDYITANYITTAKRAGKGGDFLIKDGSPIFRETFLVEYKPTADQHKLCRHTGFAEALQEVSHGLDMVDPVEKEIVTH
jgi:hypothetical protein